MTPQRIELAVTVDEEENCEAVPSSKEIVEVLSVLRRSVQQRADEHVFEQHYSYESIVIKLFDAKKRHQ